MGASIYQSELGERNLSGKNRRNVSNQRIGEDRIAGSIGYGVPSTAVLKLIVILLPSLLLHLVECFLIAIAKCIAHFFLFGHFFLASD